MNAMRVGKLALMTPVTTLVLGRWVATTRWMPTALAFWASRVRASSVSEDAVIIKSASSSIRMTTRYSLLPPLRATRWL